MPFSILVEYGPERDTLEVQVKAVPEIGSKFFYGELDSEENTIRRILGIVKSVEYTSLHRPVKNKYDYPVNICSTTIILQDVVETIREQSIRK